MAKTCPKCGETKDASEFHRNASKKDGLAWACKSCVSQRAHDYYQANREDCLERNKEQYRRWAEEHPEEARARWKREDRFVHALSAARHWAKKHGHASCCAAKDEIEAAFTGNCHVCGLSEKDHGKKLNLDHDHESGVLRGWLCNRCNLAAGLLCDSPDRMRALAEYIERTTVLI